jgi:hypothetical protein
VVIPVPEILRVCRERTHPCAHERAAFKISFGVASVQVLETTPDFPFITLLSIRISPGDNLLSFPFQFDAREQKSKFP